MTNIITDTGIRAMIELEKPHPIEGCERFGCSSRFLYGNSHTDICDLPQECKMHNCTHMYHTFECPHSRHCDECNCRIDCETVFHDYSCSHSRHCDECNCRIDCETVFHDYSCSHSSERKKAMQ